MVFASGVVGTVAPIDGDGGCAALGLVSGDLALQVGGVGLSAFETGAAQHTELNLRIALS